MSEIPQLSFDVFISYRRESGEIMGKLLFEMLKNHYNVFFDHESLSSGRFDKKLLDIISCCNDIIFILSPHCFDRCCNEGDWFMQEISCALKNSKNIILLLMDGFEIPAGEELLNYPKEIRNLVRYNGYRVNVAYMDGVISKLCNDMITQKKAVASPVDSISEWNNFSRCLSDKEFAKNLPVELKANILHGAISSFLDEYNAKIFTSVLDRITSQVYNVRTKYRYEIDIDDEFDFYDINIAPQKYYELSETLSYSKIFFTELPDKYFWLAFTTNLDELDTTLRDETFFFSENLLMEKEDVKLLCELEEEKKEEFYLSAMHVKININGVSLKPQKVIIEESGIFAKYALDEKTLLTTTLDVKLRFRIPQKNSDGHFFASISEPTYSPFIRFSYPEESFDITMIPFLNRSVTAKDTKIFEGVRELSIENEWVLPVSGAMFLINKIQ